MSDADYDKWQSLVDAEIEKITSWMQQNMSKGAEYRFADLNNLKRVIKFSNAVNERHNKEKI